LSGASRQLTKTGNLVLIGLWLFFFFLVFYVQVDIDCRCHGAILSGACASAVPMAMLSHWLFCPGGD
jgi:hypothetical protein